MAKVISISIKTTNELGKNKTTNVSYINPTVEDEKLKQFAQMLVALTNETYEGVTKVTKGSVI